MQLNCAICSLCKLQTVDCNLTKSNLKKNTINIEDKIINLTVLNIHTHNHTNGFICFFFILIKQMCFENVCLSIIYEYKFGDNYLLSPENKLLAKIYDHNEMNQFLNL